MARGRVSMEVGDDGVAIITLLNPPVNTLDITTCKDFEQKYDEALRRSNVKAILITGANGKFSSGFDLNIFEKAQKTGDLSTIPIASFTNLINTIEDGRKPSIAVIQGFAYGGGLEVAMGCHARISTPKTQLAFTEFSLGIIPGVGGSQRLPRLVGVQKATEMLLTSKSITSEEGVKIGLINAVAPPQELLKVSRMWALDIAEGRKPLVRSLHTTHKLGSLSETRAYLMIQRQKAKQTVAHENMPSSHQRHQLLACIDVIENGIVYGGTIGLVKEKQALYELLLSDLARSKLHVFVAQSMASKVSGVTDVGLKPRNIKKVGVIGGGLMGAGIAIALLLSNIKVVLKEDNSELLARGIKSIQDNMRGLVMKQKLVKDKAEKAFSRLTGVLDYLELKDVDMVIENVVEDVSLKQTILSELEKACPSHCILATNTSTLDLNVIGERTNSQERIAGAHFFSPAHGVPLLEIVRTNKTSAQVILDLITVAKAMKKVPVVVGNCTGFSVNRTFFPYSQSAHLLVNLGVDLFRIERVISDFGMNMGPFQRQDLDGYAVALAKEKEFHTAFPDRSFKSPLVELLVKYGRAGKTNGKGYYIYEKGSEPKPDPSVLPIIEESRKLTRIMPGDKPIGVSDQAILEMILFPVVNEACRVLEEGLIVRASDLDVASILGMSFPSYRGGIVFWANMVGPSHIYNCLKKWSRLYGSFFEPSRFLEERVAKGSSLDEPDLSLASRSCL